MPTIAQLAHVAHDAYKPVAGVEPFQQNLVKAGITRLDWVRTDAEMAVGFYRAGRFVIAAFRGTDNLKDVAQDVQLYTHNKQQFVEAAAFTVHRLMQLGARGEDIILTGHSLGGVQAKHVAWKMDEVGEAPAVTYAFNAPSLTQGFWSALATIAAFGHSGISWQTPSRSNSGGIVVNVNMAGDVVSNFGVPLGHVITLRGRNAKFGSHSIGTLASALDNEVLGQAPALEHALGLGDPRPWSAFSFFNPVNN